MQIATIIVFVCLFWRADVGADWQLSISPVEALIVALFQPAAIAVLSHLVFRRVWLSMRDDAGPSPRAYEVYHRATLLLRAIVVGLFAGMVLCTPIATSLTVGSDHPALLVASDGGLLLLFAVDTAVVWIFGYRIEARLRGHDLALLGTAATVSPQGTSEAARPEPVWPLGSYLDFHFRHEFLVVAAPMFLILAASHWIRSYEADIVAACGVSWGSDVLLGTVATAVFVIAPVMLRRIWRTRSLESGPMRERLEALCRQIGLRCRDILVWNSGGMMVNAAVMGVVSPFRYVLLSDALLARMAPRQIEAVFGHEAGHVRHHHMEHFLVFAFLGWLVVGGGMELVARLVGDGSTNGGAWALAIESVGIAGTALFWGLGFGAVSRRFERQADLHGARCVTPESGECTGSCAVHLGPETVRNERGRVCATAAALFASALHRVALLNGIPTEERSWRHSSIGSRIRFLTSLAGDPALARRFERTVRGIQLGIWIVAALGTALGTWYAMTRPLTPPTGAAMSYGIDAGRSEAAPSLSATTPIRTDDSTH